MVDGSVIDLLHSCVPQRMLRLVDPMLMHGMLEKTEINAECM